MTPPSTIPPHKHPRVRSFIPSFLGGPLTATEKKAAADKKALIEALTACPAITVDGEYHLKLILPYSTKMSALLASIPSKTYHHADRSWRFRVDAGTKLLANLPLIQEVWESGLPHVENDHRSADAIVIAKRLLEEEWWLHGKGSRALLEGLIAKPHLNTVEVKFIKTLAASSPDKRAKIEKRFAGDLAMRPEEFQSENVERLREAVDFMVKLDPDQAKVDNGEGFNATDTTLGHYLASLSTWKMTHAYAAYRMLKKYRKQLGRSRFEAIYGGSV